MKVYIDNSEVDLPDGENISITLSIANITDIETGKTGYTKLFRIPATQRNMEVLGDPQDIYACEMFNQRNHTARIEVNGFTVISGTALLSKYQKDGSGMGWFYVNVIGAGKDWIKTAAEGTLADLQLDYSKIINSDTVESSWTDQEPVKYFPVQREDLAVSSDKLEGCVRMMTFSDYYPFIRIKDIFEKVASQAGYTFRSGFMDSEFFGKLYMSGMYKQKSVSSYLESMGFRAVRLNSSTATADRFGRVYADPLTSVNSLGNIVDTADSDQAGSAGNGKTIFNKNNVFGVNNGLVYFKPTREAKVGFEYKLKYRTDYVIKNREELQCFNTVYLDDCVQRQFKVMNRFIDLRDGLAAGVNMTYRIIVFGHQSGETYRLTYGSSNTALCTLSARTGTFTVNLGTAADNLKLWVLSSGNYVEYTDDWAVYEGYVTERGQTDVEITVRSMASTIVPSLPRYFDLIYFGGAEEGMSMTLYEGATVTPVFYEHPVEGDNVTFADIAAHDVTQLSVITAIKQMFNLYIQTDSLNKIIYVEPREDFYTSEIIDWSDRMDTGKPVQTEELGADLAEELVFCYRSGDGEVSRFNLAEDDKYGEYRAKINNLLASSAVKYYRNPLFTPSISRNSQYSDAPEAYFIQAGERASTDSATTVNLNFPAKIVLYNGMKTLRSGAWGWPSYGNKYPEISFHDLSGGTTLCFEDRDGLTGLHRYYDRNIELYNGSKRITAYMRLRPEDIESLIAPNDLNANFTKLYRLKIGNETVLCRLEEISDYNPDGAGSTKCIFIKHI